MDKRNQRWHFALMKFFTKCPEHLGMLEQDLKRRATIEIVGDHMAVRAITPQADASWRKPCKDKLRSFLNDYVVKIHHVRNFDPALLNDPHTNVEKWGAERHHTVIAVAGLAKDVAKKIHELEQLDRTEQGSLYPETIFMNIEPIHGNRITPKLLEDVMKSCRVSIVRTSPFQVRITGMREGIERARQSIIDEIFRTKLDKISCPRWIFDNLGNQKAEAESFFPEIQIWFENGHLNIKGHPAEVNLVQKQLRTQVEMFAQRTETKTLCVPDWLQRYLAKHISEEKVKWPDVKIAVLNSKIQLTGHPSEVVPFLRQLEKITRNLQTNMTCESLAIHKGFHRCIIGKGGQKIKRLTEKYEVSIDVPADSSSNSDIKLSGKKDDVQAAKSAIKQFIQELESSTKKKMTITPSMSSWAANFVEELKKEYFDVKIEVNGNQIILMGQFDRVYEAFAKLQKEVDDKKDTIKSVSFALSGKQLLGIVGYRYQGLKKLRSQCSASINYRTNPPHLILEGDKETVEHTHVDIVRRIPHLTNFCILEVFISTHWRGQIIGPGGRNLTSLKSLYPGVIDVILPPKGRDSDNTILTGDRTKVIDLCSFLENRYNARRIGFQTAISTDRGGVRSRKSEMRGNGSYGSLTTLPGSMMSLDLDDDNNSCSGGCNAEEDQPAKFGAVCCSWKFNHNCILDFVKKSSSHVKILREKIQTEVSVAFSQREIFIAGQTAPGDEQTWIDRCKTYLEEFFDTFSYEEMTFHPLSSVERSNSIDDSLMITWEDDSVTVCGVRGKVEEKIAEFEKIKNRKRPVCCLWQSQSKYVVAFVKESLSDLSELKDLCKSLGEVKLNEQDVTVNGEILEVSSQDQWVKECSAILDEFFSRFKCDEIDVPPLLAGEMRVFCEAKPDLTALWEDGSLLVYGRKSEVDVKVDFLKKTLDKIKSRKKRVSMKWHSDDDDVFSFVKDSTSLQEKFITYMNEMGSPVFGDDAVTVNSEILATSSTEEWDRNCRSKVIKYFSQYEIKRIDVPVAIAHRAKFLADIRPSVVTKWNENENRLWVCGTKVDVNQKAYILKRKLDQLEEDEASKQSATSEFSSLESDQDETVSLKLPKIKADCAIASLTTNEVTARRVPGGIELSGKKSKVSKAKDLVDSLVFDRLDVKKYGAYEFLTDTSRKTNMQIEFFGIQHNCSLIVEQVPDSEWGDKNFICVPVEKDVKVSPFGTLTVTVTEGDITKEAVDMIVNTTDESFSFSGPLSKMVLNEGGRELKDLCRVNMIDDRMGLTPGGRLRCKKIMHVAIPKSHDSMETLIYKILANADENDVRTITLPTIGGGGGGWKCQDIALCTRKGILRFVEANPKPRTLKEVKIILFPTMGANDKRPFYDNLTTEAEQEKKTTEASPENSGGLHLMKSFIYNLSRAFRTTAPQAAESQPSQVRSGGNLDGTEDQEGAEIKKTEHGEFAKVVIYSDNKRSVEDAKKELVKFIDRHLKEFSFADRSILRLKNTDLEKMKKLAEEQSVRVIINREKDVHTVTIQGRDEFASRVRDEVQKIVSSISTDFPDTWCQMKDTQKLLRVNLKPTSTEYIQVEQRFQQANKSYFCSFTVISIERIQNPALYRQYQSKKDEILKRATSKKVERKLFHGTDNATVDKICSDGFDRNYAGKNATAYGKGVYFSSMSSYSNSYTSQVSRRQMFLARVLTGEYCQGNSSMVAAPRNPSNGELYDSVVDATYNPTIFVVFRDWSVYPSYVITYSC